MIVTRVIVPLLVVGGLLTGTGVAQARDGNAPLSTWGGCTDFVTADYGDNGWECQAPGDTSSGTVGDGTWVEARWPGWCTDPATGVRRTATIGHHVRCG